MPAEIVEPLFQKPSEARPFVNQAIKHFKEAKRATIQVMADLCLLHDRGAHVVYGEPRFAVWAANTFDGLGVSNVENLIHAGRVVQELDRAGRIDLSTPEGVGTTALRALSPVLTKHGADKMLEVFDTAKEKLEPGRDMSGSRVLGAQELLGLRPVVVLDIPLALPEDTEDDEPTKPPSPLDEDDPERLVLPEIYEFIAKINDDLWELGHLAGKEFDAALTAIREDLIVLEEMKPRTTGDING